MLIKGTDKNTTAEIQAGSEDALEGENLDHLAKVAVDTDLPTTVHDNSVLGYLLAIANVSNYDRTEDSAEAMSAKLAAIDSLTRRIIKTVQFDGGAGSGAVGSVAIFTVTGGVDYSIEIFCTETLVDATNLATISLGTAASTAQIIAITGAAGQGGTTIAANEIWHDNAPDASTELTSDASKDFTSYGEDIIYTIAGETVSDGTLVASIIYTPRTTGASVEAA